MVSPRDRAERFEAALARAANRRVELRLYIAGATTHSARALRTVMEVCELYLKNRYALEVIDIYQQPGRARDDQIVALPTLVRTSPAPLERFVGDLSDRERVIRALGVVASLHKHAAIHRTTPKPPRR